MSDDNVIPLFTAEAQEEKPATLTPAPEGPISPNNSPGSTVKDTSCRAGVVPKE